MYEGLISEIIEEFWGVGFPLDLVARDLFDIRELFIKPRKIITIVGLRRVGKTYAPVSYTHLTLPTTERV